MIRRTRPLVLAYGLALSIGFLLQTGAAAPISASAVLSDRAGLGGYGLLEVADATWGLRWTERNALQDATIVGAGESLKIEVYERVFVFVPNETSPVGVRAQIHEHVLFAAERGRGEFRIDGFDARGAIYVDGARSMISGAGAEASIQGVAIYANYAGESHQPMRGYGAPDPFSAQRSDRAIPALVTGATSRILDPAFAILWGAVIQGSDAEGNWEVDPERIVSPLAGPGTAVERWIVLAWGAAGHVEVDLGGAGSNALDQFVIGTNLAILNATSLWVERSSGTLLAPNFTVRFDDSRLWMDGTFDIGLATVDDSDAYRMTVTGESTLIETSHGTYVLPPAATAAAFSLLAAAIAALILVRDALARIAGTITGALYTKLKRPELLDHERRQALFETICREPGVTFLQLHQRLREHFGRGGGLGFGSLTYHLSQLERFGMIVSKREGRFRRFFQNGASFGRDNVRIALLQTPPVPELARIVLEEPGLSQSQLHVRMLKWHDLTRQTIAYHLGRLVAKELVEVEAKGRQRHYRATAKLAELAVYAQAKTASMADVRKPVPWTAPVESGASQPIA